MRRVMLLLCLMLGGCDAFPRTQPSPQPYAAARSQPSPRPLPRPRREITSRTYSPSPPLRTAAIRSDQHWLDSKSDDGGILKLEDGSVWEVEPIDRITSMLWLTTDDILIVYNRSGGRTYRLINLDDQNESVEASRLR